MMRGGSDVDAADDPNSTEEVPLPLSAAMLGAGVGAVVGFQVGGSDDGVGADDGCVVVGRGVAVAASDSGRIIATVVKTTAPVTMVASAHRHQKHATRCLGVDGLHMSWWR